MTKIDFKNTDIGFKIKSNSDLKRAYLLFKVISFPLLVNISKALTSFALRLKIPISWIVKPTIYRHFVGGETISDCLQSVSRLKEFDVYSILDFSVEGSSDEVGINAALQETIRTIQNAAANPAIPFAVFKPTAFANHKLFENADPIKPMEGELEKEYYRFRSRLNILFDEAFKKDVPLMVDAEDSWYQHLVDDTIEEMMKRYNREKAIVFNTLQMYRTDRIEFLKNSIAKARAGKYFLGLKFVRGAYMEKERQRALEKGYPSPIHADKESTDAAFDEAIKISLENADIVTIFCGSHNELSNLKFAEGIRNLNFDKKDNRFWFSQLYGMSDHISFNLANGGYNVTKYIPYGPVKSVMPYLFRRAEENTSVSGQTSRELSLIKSEIKRRKSH